MDVLSAPKAALRAIGLYRPARALYRFTFDRRYREGLRLERRRPAGLFQPFAMTREDRYPAIFRFVREQLGDGAGLRILSFGCATGEEVFSLRRHFAAAFIKGVDINPRTIAVAEARRAREGDTNMIFAPAGTTAGEPAESYDAIFCMAVLRHSFVLAAERCDPHLRFADFERTVGDFARCLKPGGLLALRHCNFRFSDAAASEGFEPAMRLADPPPTPLFGRDDRRLWGVAYSDVVFRKSGPPLD